MSEMWFWLHFVVLLKSDLGVERTKFIVVIVVNLFTNEGTAKFEHFLNI